MVTLTVNSNWNFHRKQYILRDSAFDKKTKCFNLDAAGQLVCPLVFKTSVRRVERLGWVRFPHVSAKRREKMI